MNGTELNLLHSGHGGTRLVIIVASLSAPLSSRAWKAFPFIEVYVPLDPRLFNTGSGRGCARPILIRYASAASSVGETKRTP